MITINVPKSEVFNSESNIFYRVEKPTTIQLEHSLISLQKWESKWHKPFLVKGDKTIEETIDYIRCMCVTPNVKDDVFYCIPLEESKRISNYIEDTMTATTFKDTKKSGTNKEIITSEIIYYWMVALNIPSEYKKWHLNQLLTLIHVTSLKNSPKKKGSPRSRRSLLEEHKAINERNRKLLKTKG